MGTSYAISYLLGDLSKCFLVPLADLRFTSALLSSPTGSVIGSLFREETARVP